MWNKRITVSIIAVVALSGAVYLMRGIDTTEYAGSQAIAISGKKCNEKNLSKQATRFQQADELIRQKKGEIEKIGDKKEIQGKITKANSNLLTLNNNLRKADLQLNGDDSKYSDLFKRCPAYGLDQRPICSRIIGPKYTHSTYCIKNKLNPEYSYVKNVNCSGLNGTVNDLESKIKGYNNSINAARKIINTQKVLLTKIQNIKKDIDSETNFKKTFENKQSKKMFSACLEKLQPGVSVSAYLAPSTTSPVIIPEDISTVEDTPTVDDTLATDTMIDMDAPAEDTISPVEETTTETPAEVLGE